MPVTDDRLHQLLEVRCYLPGQGDPFVTRRASGWYDVLRESHPYGSSTRTALGIPYLEYLPNVGLVCRPFLVQQDTQKASYNTSGGTWEDRYQSTGAPPRYRLAQVNNQADTQWSATSSDILPANPDVAFTVKFFDVPSNHDPTTYPPYIRIELGGGGAGSYGVLFDREQGNFLIRNIAGSWQVAAELGSTSPDPVLAGGETVIFVRFLRGGIHVSLDRGKTYTSYWLPQGSVSCPAGRLIFRGQGSAAQFGFHQLRYYAGTYTSPTKNTYVARGELAEPTFTWSRYFEPNGSTVVFADAGTPTAGVARYTATLTPSTLTTLPFIIYRSPELYATALEYAAEVSTAFGLYETDWTGTVLLTEVDKPLKLDEGTLTLTLNKDPDTQFTGNYRRRKLALIAGDVLTTGGIDWKAGLVCYIRTVTPVQTEFGFSQVEITGDNASILFKEAQWTDLDRVPFAGRTVNQALDAILASEGLNSSYRTWHPKGDVVIVPLGSPEDPGEWPRRGEDKWTTLQRIAGYAGLEIVPLDDGRFATGPLDYVYPVVTHEFEAAPESDLAAAIKSLRNTVDYSQSATAILVYSQGERGEQLLAYAVDTQAEGNVFSPRFSPWRVIVQEDIPGTSNLGLMTSRAAGLALQLFGLKMEPELTTPLNLELSRRDRVRIKGTYLGIADYDEFVVLSLRHTIKFDPAYATVDTVAGLRRLN